MLARVQYNYDPQFTDMAVEGERSYLRYFGRGERKKEPKFLVLNLINGGVSQLAINRHDD